MIANTSVIGTFTRLSAVTCFAALVIPSSTNAQQQKVFMEGEAGVALPTGKLARVSDPGPNVGLQVGYQLSDRVALKLNGDVALLNGAAVSNATRGPDMRLWHYGGGVEANLLPRHVNHGRRQELNRWQVIADVAAGATTWNTDRFSWASDPDTPRDFSETYFATQGGLKIRYAATPRIGMFLRSKANWTFANRTDTGSLANIDPTRLDAFKTAFTIPLTAGMIVKI